MLHLGGTLLAQTVWDMYQGKATRQPQDEAASSYYSFPTEQDFIVPVHEWGADRVFNFIRGVGHWEQPIQLLTDHGMVSVPDAVSYSLEATNEPHGQMDIRAEHKLDGITGHRMIACKNGTVVIVEE